MSSCPNGCGRQMARSARECRQCANERRRREQSGTFRQMKALDLHNQGMTYKRIAGEMNISTSRALQLVRRAMVAVEATMEPR